MSSVLWVATGLNPELTGIERLVLDSVSELAMSGLDQQTIVAHEGDRWLDDVPPAVEVLMTPRRAAEVARQPRLPDPQRRFDLVHSYAAPPPRGRTWTGYTVHDWGPFFERALPPVARAAWVAGITRGIRAADTVHFMADSVRGEAPKALRGWLGRKPTLSGLAALGQLTDTPDEDSASDPCMVLTVGSDVARKRFGTLVAAISSTEHLHLVCAGSNTDSRTAPPKIVGLGRVSDAVLMRLYRQAQVFALVSEYEGFGLPVLEAWEAGCQLVISDAVRKRLPPAIGDAALVVASDAPSEEIAAALVTAAALPRRRPARWTEPGVVVAELRRRSKLV